MKRYFFALLLIGASISCANAFEADGFRSGMPISEAKRLLENNVHRTIKVSAENIQAWDENKSSSFINLGFCKGKLVLYEKHLEPRFDYFVRLMEKKRQQLGPPVDAWGVPTDLTATFESNTIKVLWKYGNSLEMLSYTKFESNDQLSLIYETKNKCYEIPY